MTVTRIQVVNNKNNVTPGILTGDRLANATITDAQVASGTLTVDKNNPNRIAGTPADPTGALARFNLTGTIAGGPFTLGEVVNGSASSAAGTVHAQGTNWIEVDVTSGIFVAGDTVTGVASSASIDGGLTIASVPVMAGLAIPLTPSQSGKVKVTITGTVSNTASSDGAWVGIAYGTGAAPANGDDAQGTIVGNTPSILISTGGGQLNTFALEALLTGLALATPLWFDLEYFTFSVAGGSTATVSNISYIIEEV